jgi:phosphoribosylformylglycinamidine synthase
VSDAALAKFAQLPEPLKEKRRAAVRVIVLEGLGLNCEDETALAFRRAGAAPEQVHVTDLLDRTKRLGDYQILAFPGGFAFGDHLGAGFVLANRLRFRLYDDLAGFVARGGLSIGICNGFQTMVRLGLLPGFDGDYRTPRATLAPNERLGYYDGWVTLAFDPASPCLWTRGLTRMEVPSRHGEGMFLPATPDVLARLTRDHQIVARYAGPDGKPTQEWPFNPNGSPDAIAGICDATGRLFGLMPHPDAHLFPIHHPHWMRSAGASEPSADGEGMAIFRNGVDAAAALLT